MTKKLAELKQAWTELDEQIETKHSIDITIARIATLIGLYHEQDKIIKRQQEIIARLKKRVA